MNGGVCWEMLREKNMNSLHIKILYADTVIQFTLATEQQTQNFTRVKRCLFTVVFQLKEKCDCSNLSQILHILLQGGWSGKQRANIICIVGYHSIIYFYISCFLEFSFYRLRAFILISASNAFPNPNHLGSITFDCTIPYISLMDVNDDQTISFKENHY